MGEDMIGHDQARQAEGKLQTAGDCRMHEYTNARSYDIIKRAYEANKASV